MLDEKNIITKKHVKLALNFIANRVILLINWHGSQLQNFALLLTISRMNDEANNVLFGGSILHSKMHTL